MPWLNAFAAFFFGFHAFAGLDAEFAQRLVKARNKNQIASLVQQYEDLRVSRSACRLQIRQKSLPLACYETLFAEKKWNLLSDDRSAHLRQLDELCETAAAELRLPKNLPARMGFLSARCWHALSQAKAIRDYRGSQPEAGPGIEHP